MDDNDLTYIPPFLDRNLPKETDVSDDVGDQPVPDGPPPGDAHDVTESAALEAQSAATELKAPHALADLFPMMDDKALREITADILDNGLMEPIITYEGKVLDGRNRQIDCSNAGVTPDYEEYTGDDALAYIIRKNLFRRHLKPSQRAMIAARMANLKRGGDHKSKDFKSSNDGLRITDAAETLGVSPKTVERAKTVLAGGDEALIEAVESGEMSVSAAANRLAKPDESEEPVVTVSEGERESQRLLKLWGKTGEKGRALFLEGIGIGAND